MIRKSSILKIYLLVLLVSSSLFAQSNFWTKVTSIEKSYYSLDTNKTDENSINSLIDKKYNDFQNLIEILKNKPYDLTEKNSFTIDEQEKTKLLQKIKINKQYGYNVAVTRDTLRLKNLEVKQKMYLYFVTLSNSWVNYSSDDLEKLNQEYIDYLSRLEYDKYLKKYDKVKSIDAKIENEIKKSFEDFNVNYMFFNDVLGYINLNKTIFSYESLSNFLKIGTLITEINSDDSFSYLNTKLRFIHLDMGRIILFLSVIITFSFLAYIIYRKIYDFFKLKIYKKADDIDDILMNNLNKIRKPVSFLVILIGLKLSLEILVYPNSIQPLVLNFFYIIIVLNFIYLSYVFIDNMTLVYLTNKNDDNIRKELVALIVSVSKIVIFLIGLLLVLVNFDVNISGILASLGIGGLAVALAAQSTLSNFFGLIKMIADKSFSIGDWIQTTDVEGTVVQIGFISTKIRTFDNALITVPNSTLANSSIKNWNKRKIGRRIKMHIGVTYKSNKQDLQNAITQIKDMLQNHQDIITSSKIDYKQINKFYKQEQKLTSVDDKYGIKSTLLVYLDKFNESSIDILIYTFTKTTSWDQWLEIKEDVLFKIWNILEKNNLEFAFPSQSIYIEK